MKQLSLSTIICGTIIVLAPIIYNLVSMAMLTHLLAAHPTNDFHFNGMLDNSYQSWCLFIGICLFTVGIISGFRADRRPVVSQPLVPLTPSRSNG